MALRAVVKRGKALAWRGWHHYQRDSGILGAISTNRSIFSHHHPCSSIPLLTRSFRHYYLPPAPLVRFRSDFDVEDEDGSDDVFPVNDLIGEASPIALFALMTHNETQDRNLRFVRVVRASFAFLCGRVYYLTLEAIDENGNLNVYYAEVQILNSKRLLKWELVDESFDYPFLETSVVRIAKNIRCKIDDFEDIEDESMNSAGTVAHATGTCSQSLNDEIGLHITRRPDEIVYYAASALKMLKKKAGKVFFLKEVLHAIEEKVDDKAFYILVLKAIKDEKEWSFLYAIFELPEFEEESIKWNAVDELFSVPLKNSQIVAGARDTVKHISDDLSRMGEKRTERKERTSLDIVI